MANDPEKRFALEQWLQTASPEGSYTSHNQLANNDKTPITNSEQHTVLKMFKSAEEAQVKEVSLTK